LNNPYIIVFSEKNGFFYYLKELYQEFDVTVVALGGQPSVLSTEYLVNHILEKCLSDQIFYTFSIVDYDPSGGLIEQNFKSLLYEQGLTEIVSKSIVQPSLYTPEEIELYRYPLSKNSKAQKINKKWLEATQGVNGEPYGLEADSLPKDRLMDAIKVELIKLKEMAILKEGEVQS